MELTSSFINRTFWILGLIALSLKILQKFRNSQTLSNSSLNAILTRYFFSFYLYQIPLTLPSAFVYLRYIEKGLTPIDIAHLRVTSYSISTIFSFFAGSIINRIGLFNSILLAMIFSLIITIFRGIGGFLWFILGQCFLGFCIPLSNIGFNSWIMLDLSTVDNCPEGSAIYTEINTILKLFSHLIIVPIADTLRNHFSITFIYQITVLLFIISIILFSTFCRKYLTQLNQKTTIHKKDDEKTNNQDNKQNNNQDNNPNKENKNGEKNEKTGINEKETNIDNNKSPGFLKSFLNSFKSLSLIREKSLIAALILQGIYGILPTTYTSQLPSFFIAEQKLPFSALLSCNTISSLLGTMLYRTIESKIKAKNHTKLLNLIEPLLFILIIFSFILQAIVFDQKILLFISMCFFHALDGACQVILVSQKQKLYPSSIRNQLLGIMSVCSSLGATFYMQLAKKLTIVQQLYLISFFMFVCFICSRIISHTVQKMKTD